ncbi:MFS monocarboxylate transporter [Cordyceps fumosorosea ARSEF 2679]|uniref:MFS monocarboxylate transporter n=1 Tax=Cordyceps fumosorosea (strain ARSEF 2679) TaxID=1081104 RepID=A0A167S9L4_CORFA|nr:MFS monocarboxylate transporter [Cordyceps fumosorosea ARSEF 2679]OAA59399.1 MFS monocarboxylate transporter [Cordyceps fumosorosea ARSEF 2679]
MSPTDSHDSEPRRSIETLQIQDDNAAGGTSLPPTDHGRDAYLALACCTVAQAPIWGKPTPPSLKLFSSIPFATGYSVAFGIFQEYYTSDESPIKAPPGAFATIGALQMGVMYLMMPVAFMALSWFPRLRPWCGPLGLAVTVASLCASAYATTVGGLIATQGALYSVGCGLLFSPVSQYMDEWFSARKGLAYGVMWAGKSLVGMIMPFVFSGLLARLGLRATLLSWAGASAVLTLPTLFFLRPRVPLRLQAARRRVSLGFLRQTSFWMMQVGIVLQALGYVMPSTYMASYATDVGYASITKPILISMFSLSGTFGALFLGMMSDRLDATRVVLISALGSAAPVFLLWGLSRHLANVIAFALVYGFFAGGFSSTWTSMTREIQRDDRTADPSLLFGLLMGGRGVGFVAGGPLSVWPNDSLYRADCHLVRVGPVLEDLQDAQVERESVQGQHNLKKLLCSPPAVQPCNPNPQPDLLETQQNLPVESLNQRTKVLKIPPAISEKEELLLKRMEKDEDWWKYILDFQNSHSDLSRNLHNVIPELSNAGRFHNEHATVAQALATTRAVQDRESLFFVKSLLRPLWMEAGKRTLGMPTVTQLNRSRAQIIYTSPQNEQCKDAIKRFKLSNPEKRVCRLYGYNRELQALIRSDDEVEPDQDDGPNSNVATKFHKALNQLMEKSALKHEDPRNPRLDPDSLSSLVRATARGEDLRELKMSWDLWREDKPQWF